MTETTPFDCVNLENMCRVCYRSDLSIHLASFEEITALRTLALEPYFSSMTPLYFCVYCAAILKKSVLFVKQCTTKETTLSELHYNNMSIKHLDSTTINTISLFDNEMKEETSVDDAINGEDNHFGDDEENNFGDDRNDDTISLFNKEIKEETLVDDVVNGEDNNFGDEHNDDNISLFNNEIKEETLVGDEIDGEHDYVGDERNDDDDLPLNMLKCKEDLKGTSKHEKDTTAGGLQTHPADHRPPTAEGVHGTGSVFSKRMVRETEQYLVIKLTKNEVLEEIKEKLLSEKYITARYKCDKCAKEFNFEDVLRNHMEKHSGKSGYVICELCGQYLPSKVSLRGHMKSHTTRYKCKLCGVIKKARQHLLEHYTLSHCGDSAKYTCDLCTFVTNKRTVIQRHTRTHGPAKRHICDMCGKTCKTLEALRVHRIRHDTSKQYQCPSCPRRFVYPSLLQRHVREAHELAHNYCVECDRTFTAKETLQNHFKNSRRHRDTPAFECKTCGDKFDSRAQLGRHRTRDHGEPVPSYQCESCPKKYQCKDALRAHIRRVHNKLAIQRRHTCSQCNKEFTEKHSLTRHLRTHTDTPSRRKSTQAKKSEVDSKCKSS